MLNCGYLLAGRRNYRNIDLNMCYNLHMILLHFRDQYNCHLHYSMKGLAVCLYIGYDLVDLPENKIFSIPAYDYMRNIEYKKKPNLIEILFYYLKRFFYISFSINANLQRFYFKILNYFRN